MRQRALSLLLSALGALCACGPVGATSVITDAELAVARAHAADGDRYAIYETTAADLYLQKAREEQGAALYGNAIELAKRSVELADAATRRAAEAKKAPVAPQAPPASIQRPAEAKPPEVKPPEAKPPKEKPLDPLTTPVPLESDPPPPPPPPPEKK